MQIKPSSSISSACHVRVKPKQAHKQPMSVNRRMPIERSVEGRMLFRGDSAVLRSGENIGRLVRVLPVESGQGKSGELIRTARIEGAFTGENRHGDETEKRNEECSHEVDPSAV